MNNEHPSLQTVFAPIFEPELISEIEEKSMLINAHAGQSLIEMGKPIKMVPMVLDGTLKVSRINEEGQELLLYYVRKGEGCAMTFSCGMMAQTSLVTVAAMEEWMVKYRSWKKFVMSTIVNEFMDVINSVDAVAFKKMDDRLVKYLKEKSKIAGSSIINVTHQQIGDELGTNRVVVSRLLKKLETENRLLLYRNQIKLLKEL
jgi:CRP/FNR family transcriptional regulator